MNNPVPPVAQATGGGYNRFYAIQLTQSFHSEGIVPPWTDAITPLDAPEYMPTGCASNRSNELITR